MMQTIYSVNELAERWGMHPSTVREMERDGKLHRLPEIPGVRFSAAEVLQLESIGKDVEPLTVWERRKLEADNRQLKEENAELKRRLCNIGQLAIGG
ncbi:MAG: hypothetical protein IKO69_03470 [Acidaminococcaceae bacterium]|nr:hypothetical protein [Acidaminococcaceae bacterium]MBR6817903.1 hypothetical protein [Acidaminococcaceae bacterium]